MTCPQEQIPAGWKVWRGTEVPAPLIQLAIDVRDHIRDYPRGTIAQTVDYNGQTVGVFVSSHTWTYRNGKLVTGICIPGASLIVKQAAGPGTTQVTAIAPDNLDTPDPTAAVFGADDVPAPTDWKLVAMTAGLGAAVVVAFLWALKTAGRAASTR
jgi:hypothetical protein